MVDRGYSTGDTAVIDAADDTRYFVSVLPDAGYTMSGTSVASGQATAIVIVNPYPGTGKGVRYVFLWIGGFACRLLWMGRALRTALSKDS